ncbi:MAG TPA: glycoside hydrolase family 15 protein [Solirubrobacterales bacterium]|nr:glycoside hydrolase family 15 protein [Solirubrobacterales bacterium]
MPDFLNIKAIFAVLALLATTAVLVSGGEGSDPRTPAGLPGLPPPFLGTAVVGRGGETAAVDAYGNVVDLRPEGPAGEATIEVSAERQAAGSVAADTGLVARTAVTGGSLPFWRADSVRQRYLPGTNVLRTEARFGDERAVVVRSLGGPAAARADRRWIAQAQPLEARAPDWARAMYERSLLVLRALTDRRTGAVAAGARDGWAYVWPRDAGAVAIALALAGYRHEARQVVHFLLGLDLDAAARFDGVGDPVPGRAAQGDAAGWVVAAARAAGLRPRVPALHWRERADYHEGTRGNYLANALATMASGAPFASQGHKRRTGSAVSGLVRVAGDSESGWDSVAAWGVRPFAQPSLTPQIRNTLLRVAATSGRFGILPSENWAGGEDPWTAPTAWTAWSLAALGERRAALRLVAALRRAATPLGLLPERVDVRTGTPRSTTPLAWSHAFAILALRELWPGRN